MSWSSGRRERAETMKGRKEALSSSLLHGPRAGCPELDRGLPSTSVMRKFDRPTSPCSAPQNMLLAVMVSSRPFTNSPAFPRADGGIQSRLLHHPVPTQPN